MKNWHQWLYKELQWLPSCGPLSDSLLAKKWLKCTFSTKRNSTVLIIYKQTLTAVNMWLMQQYFAVVSSWSLTTARLVVCLGCQILSALLLIFQHIYGATLIAMHCWLINCVKDNWPVIKWILYERHEI